MNARATTHGKAARAATTTHPAAGAGDACRRSPQGATGRAGDVPAADNRRKAQAMKKTTAKRRKAPADDFWTPDMEAAWNEAAEKREADKAWIEEHRQQEAAIITAYERRKAQKANRPGKGTSRHAGKTIGGNLKGKGKYHILPDGQTIEVAGDSTPYRITGAAALKTLDRLLDALKNGDGWTSWSKKDRARFSTPRAKAFARKYIENERSKSGIGWNYGHQPKARLKP